MARGAAKKAKEMDNLLGRLRQIQKEMPDKDEKKSSKGASKGPTDAFLDLKTEFLKQLFAVKQTIKEMQDAQTKLTTKTTDQIAKQQQTRAVLKDLDRLYKEMEAVLTKEKKRKKSKLSEQDLVERSMFLTQFKSELITLKQASTKGYIGTSSLPDLEAGPQGSGLTATNFLLTSPQSEAAIGTSATTGTAANITGAQQQQLEQIAERDKGFDATLDEIDTAVQRAGELAKAINDETELQTVMLDKVDQNIDKVQDHLDTVNAQMKKTLVEKGCGFERVCINGMCFIVLLGIVGVFINLFS